MSNKIIAKHLNYLYADSSPEQKLKLDYNSESQGPKIVEVSRSVAHRIRSGHLTKDYANNFILFLDENGVVVDIDLTPKTKNLPMEVDDTPQEGIRKNKVIFRKNKLGEISIFKNLGIDETATVDGMRTAIESRLTSDEGLKVDDVLNDQYFVSDLRDNGTFIHVELLNG